MHPIPMKCQVKLFVATVLQDLVHQPSSSLYGSNDPDLTQNAVEQILQSMVRPLQAPASQQHLARARESRQPAAGQPGSRQAATASQPASLGQPAATATNPAPATASQPQKSQGPAIQAQGSRNEDLFLEISCLRILKQLITRNKYTLRLPPLSWPGGSWDFAMGGRLVLAASWWVWLLWVALC